MLEVEKKLARRRGPCRYLLGADSQVALAALVKGWSASPNINRLLQLSLPTILGSGIYGNYGYVPSLANPSDDPTRGAELRSAVQSLPSWWAAAAAGDFTEFDAWLSSLGYDPLQLAGVPFAAAADVDRQGLVGDLLKNLASVQKPERMAKFREVSAGICSDAPGQPRKFHNPRLNSARRSLVLILFNPPCAGTGSGFSVCTVASAVSPLSGIQEQTRGHKRLESPNQEKNKRPQELFKVRPNSKAVCFQSEQSPTASRKSRNPAARVLSERAVKVLSSFKAAQFVLPNGKRATKGFVPERQGFVDLYSGAAGVARKIARTFGVWVLTVDYNDGPEQDLLQHDLQLTVKELLESGAVLGLGMAPECASFSRAVCPPVCSRSKPMGLDVLTENMRDKVRRGNLHALFCAQLVGICNKLNIPYWLENPDSSFLWLLPVFLNAGIGWPERSYRVDFCRFKTPWRKRTRVATSASLAGCCELCLRDHEHLVLRGRSAFHRMAWTRVAQVYPGGFCIELARSMGAAAGLKPLGKQAKLAIAQCAQAGHCRVGEAKNPGPVGRRVERDVNVLLGVPLVNPSTERLQRKVWADFQQWLSEELSEATAAQVFVCPALAVQMLRSYGVELYRSGHALYELRHLLALVQKLYPAVKPLLGPAWALVTQWEEINPVQHRQPLPELLYKAMVAVAWMWGWKRFVALLLLGFEGIARVPNRLAKTKICLIPIL